MEYLRTLTQEFDVGERAELQVENRSGTVSVRGEETQQVCIEVVARLWAEDEQEADDQADLIARGMRQEGPRVTVRAPSLLRPPGLLSLFGRGPRIDYQITTPQTTSARIASRSGRVDAANLAGPLEIDAKSGRVAVSDIGAGATIVSRSGTVQAEAIAGPLAIESRSGKVRVRGCGSDAQLRSRSGSVQVEEVRGALDIEGRSGSISVSDVLGGLSIKTRSGSVRYQGPVQGTFDIAVTSGAVLLAVDADSNFYLDAETMSGSVYSDMPLRRTPAGGPSSAEAGPTLRVRTRSGSIRIVPR